MTETPTSKEGASVEVAGQVAEPREAGGAPKPRYFVVSGDVKAGTLHRLRYLRRLDIYHVFQRTRKRMKADDTSAEDFEGNHFHAPTPGHVLWHLFRARPDIVQGPEPFSLLMFPYLVAVYAYVLMRPQVKLVVNSLEPIPLERKYTRLVAAPMRAVLRRYFRRASILFWFVPGVDEAYDSAGAPSERVVNHVYANWGLDLHTYHPDGASEAANGNKPTVLFVGRLVPKKGVHHLIQAFQDVRKRGVDARLLIVGDGPEREGLRRQADASGYGGDITFTGLVPNSDMPRYYRGATVMVSPFLSTRLWVPHWDNVFMEAMACGLPMIAVDSAPNREMIGADAAIFVPEGSVAGYSDAIQDVLTDRFLQQKMAEDARTEAERRFDPDRNAASAENLILRATGFWRAS